MKTPTKPPRGVASTPSTPSARSARPPIDNSKIAVRASVSAPSTPQKQLPLSKKNEGSKPPMLKTGPENPAPPSLFAKMRSAGAAKAVERKLVGRSLGDSLVQLTLDSGSKIDLDVFSSARTGSLNLLRQLVSTGQPINVADENRRTPLHLACAGGKFDCVEYLLEIRADVNATSRENEWTPLHEAATGEIVELLILARSDVDPADAWGMTPLHLAAERGNLSVVRCLLQYRAAVAAADALGRTALHLAACRGHKGVVEELASHGADLDARDRAGRSALDHAMAFQHADVAASLQEMRGLLGAMGAGGTSLRALPAGSPARLTRGPNDKPAPRPRTGSAPPSREASPRPPSRAGSSGAAVQTLFLRD